MARAAWRSSGWLEVVLSSLAVLRRARDLGCYLGAAPARVLIAACSIGLILGWDLYGVPLPCWEELEPDTARACIAETVARIATETRRQHRRAKTRPAGIRRILRQNPHHRRRRVARSPAPRFHAATWRIRRMLEQMCRAFRDAYRDAMEALQRQQQSMRFPRHGIPPPLTA